MRLLPSTDSGTGCFIFTILIWLFFIIGWIQSIVKLCKSDFHPYGKREAVYTVGTVIPIAGGVIGWFDVAESK